MAMEALKEILNEELDKVPPEALLPTHVEEIDLLKNQLLVEKLQRLKAEYALVTSELNNTQQELNTSNSMFGAKYKMDVGKDKIDPKTREIVRAK